jgi:hypothetical protein
MYKNTAKLIGNNEKTIYRWKKEERPIIDLLEKYFSVEDLEEFLETNKIKRLEKFGLITDEVFNLNKLKYMNSFYNSSLLSFDDDFISFYFLFLKELKLALEDQSEVDTLVFSSSFYIVPLNQLLNTFIVYVSSSMPTQQAVNYTYRVYKHFNIFDKWDNYMLLFLIECIDNEFKNLYDKNDDIKNKNEAIFQILGFYYFTSDKNKDFSEIEKLNLLKISYDKYLKSNTINNDEIDTILDAILPLKN